METLPASKICQIHKQQCLGVDINPYCELESRHCCEICLNIPKQFREFVTYKNALTCLENTKNEFSQKREIQFKCNTEILKNLINCIASLKTYINKALEDIVEEINKQIAGAEKIFEQSQQLYGSLDLDQFFQFKMENQEQINYQKFQLKTRGLLEKILTQEKLEQTLTQLSQLDNQVIKLGRLKNSPTNVDERKQNIQILSLKCARHNLTIRAFDLNPNVVREERVICEECFDDRSGPFTSFIKLQNKWKDYENFNKECIQLGQNVSQRKELLINGLQQFQINYCEELDKFLENLNIRHVNIREKHEDQIRMISRSWDTLETHEILDRLDEISKKSIEEIIQTKYKSEFTQISQENNEAIESLFQKLGSIQKQLIQQMTNNRIQEISQTLQFDFQKDVNIQVFGTLRIKNLISLGFQKKKKLLSRKLNIYLFSNKPKTRKTILSFNKLNQVKFGKIRVLGMKKDIVIQSNRPRLRKPILTYNKQVLAFDLKTLPLNYRIFQPQIEQSETCNVVAVNSAQTKVVAGCNQNIQTFQFLNGSLVRRQLLEEHNYDVSALVFFRKSDRFVSADSSIIVWVWLNGIWQTEWMQQQAHKKKVRCLLMFNDDNQFVSCSRDNYTKIWIRRDENQWELLKQFFFQNGQLYSMSLNFSQQQLVVSGYLWGLTSNGGVLAFYKYEQNRWQEVDRQEYRYFINNVSFAGNENLFVFQSVKENSLTVYEYNGRLRKYENQMNKSLIVNSVDDHDYQDYSFHQYYSPQNRTLVHRHGKSLYLIRNFSYGLGHFYVEQKIDFLTNQIFGTLTEDGKFLITWDDNSKQFKVWRTD